MDGDVGFSDECIDEFINKARGYNPARDEKLTKGQKTLKHWGSLIRW